MSSTPPPTSARTITLDGLSNDFHLLTIIPQQEYATVDVMHVPAITPATTQVISGYTRFEEDSTHITYNGVGFRETQRDWEYNGRGDASGGNVARSDEAGNSFEFTFNGDWAMLGLTGSNDSGEIELWLDGVSQGTLDLYRQRFVPINIIFDLPVSTTHTISATVLGTTNPLSNDNRVHLDFFDVWDGTPLPDGSFEDGDTSRILQSGKIWSNRNDADASGGTYKDTGSGAAWFPFTGESVTYQVLARSNQGWADIYLDNVFQHRVEIYSPLEMTRTFTLDGFEQ